MEKINIYINQIVPQSSKFIGKTGGNVRFLEVLKRLEKQGLLNINIRSTKCIADNLAKNGLKAKYVTIKSSLKFNNHFDLCLKSFFLIVRYFFVFFIPRSKNSKEKNVVYVTSDLFWEVIPAYICKTKNKRIEWIQVIHHAYPDWKKRPGRKIPSFFGSYLQKFSFFLIKKKADKIILVNRLMKAYLLERGFKEEKIHVSSNGIDLEYLGNLKKNNSYFDGAFLGRLDSSKGIRDLIEIWKKILAELPGVKLAAIGSVEENVREKLQKMINEAGLRDNIKIMGFLKDKEAYGILKAVKIFVFPSHEEGWGIAIAEAMACGIPVVSWNLPVYREVFENYTAQVEENNIELFSEKAIKLLKNRELWEKVSCDGREFIKRYSWDSVAEKELEIIKI